MRTPEWEALKKMSAPPKPQEGVGPCFAREVLAACQCQDPIMDHEKVQQLADYDGILLLDLVAKLLQRFAGAVDLQALVRTAPLLAPKVWDPTRLGSAAAQMKAFFDSTGSLWESGALAGKLPGRDGAKTRM